MTKLPDEDLDFEGTKTRMEVAYGAGDGDEDAKAIVAKSEAHVGTLFEQLSLIHI